jgi:carbohydrate-binding DOMON domain-containing protein
MRGPVDNPWGSPNGLSLQTLDVYLDADGDGQGGKAMLPGRNLSLAEGYAWDYAIHAEGWTSGIYVPGEEGPQQVASSSEFLILVNSERREVTIRVSKSILGDNPKNWKVGALALSQEGFPSEGVMRARDVLLVAEQWRIGGAPPGATNHTRVLDYVWPEPGTQEEWLSAFNPLSSAQSELTPEDFALVALLEPLSNP